MPVHGTPSIITRPVGIVWPLRVIEPMHFCRLRRLPPWLRRPPPHLVALPGALPLRGAPLLGARLASRLPPWPRLGFRRQVRPGFGRVGPVLVLLAAHPVWSLSLGRARWALLVGVFDRRRCDIAVIRPLNSHFAVNDGGRRVKPA
jgi:hypothetical protein